MSKNKLYQDTSILNSCWPALRTGIVLSAMISLSTFAVASTQDLTLKQAINQVNQYQASQNFWETQKSINAANIQQSKLFKNPEFSIEQTGFGSKNDKELAIGISQPLDIFGERKANQKLASISADKTALKQKIYQAQVELAVKYVWSQLAIAELEKNIVHEQLRVSEENMKAIEKRFNAGSIAQVDVNRARLSYAENIRLFRQADLQVQVATQQLSNLWGTSDKSLQINLSPQKLWPKSAHQQVQEYLADNYVEKYRILQVLESQVTVDQLKAKARPNPTLNLGINRTQSMENSAQNQLVVGVSVPLNIFDRQQNGIKIAQEKMNLLERQKDFYLKQNALQIGTVLTELQGLELQFKVVNDTQIPLAAQVQNKTLQGFLAGKFALSDVQQATLQLQDIHLRKIQLLRDGWQKAIEAESLSLGISPSEVMSKDAIAQLNQNLWQDIQAMPVIGGGN
ncbi:TolC family protein [Acinetobacter bouvetii]|uniref:TolC family protein n=1 Tax=Acinetobacter bouvetii TaxID=202951 RepID=A0A4Q7AZ08_9GAMM|nr:TolC family protein [Acinetobacter bouvetii]RZG65893.1 TolC family protein [Acinetobacter bouvetii]